MEVDDGSSLSSSSSSCSSSRSSIQQDEAARLSARATNAAFASSVAAKRLALLSPHKEVPVVKGGRWAISLASCAKPAELEDAGMDLARRLEAETATREMAAKKIVQSRRVDEFIASRRPPRHNRYGPEGILRPDFRVMDTDHTLPARTQEIKRSKGGSDEKLRGARQRPQSAPALRCSAESSETTKSSKMIRPSTASSNRRVALSDGRSHYYGDEARASFYERYRDVLRETSNRPDVITKPEPELEQRLAWCPSRSSRELTAASEEEEEEDEEALNRRPDYDSPREAFARGLAAKMAIFHQSPDKEKAFFLPEPIFVRQREGEGNSLDLGNRSYGDGLAIELSKVVRDLPDLEKLSMRDNRLTDTGISALLAAVCEDETPTLRSLDLSYNKLDFRALEELATYLRRSDCTLECLTLQNSDIDDREISVLVEALEENLSLRELSISQNYLGGTSEKMSLGRRSGAAAMAQTIHSADNRLVTLDLSWNRLGVPTGMAIGESLKTNKGLRSLSLAYNCIGDEGGQHVGRALDLNVSLTTLDLSHNNIRNRGAQVIAEGLRENNKLRKVELSGNPLGCLGGRALLSSLNAARKPRVLGLLGCECRADDPEPIGRFNPASPAGQYELDLAKPFDWMIARSLRYIAATRSGCSFTTLVERLPGSKARVVKLLKREGLAVPSKPQPPPPPPVEPTSEDAAAILKFRARMRETAVGSSIAAIVARYDLDCSGCLSHDEAVQMVRRTFKMTAEEISEEQIGKMIAVLDVDSSGSVDVEELVDFLKDRGAPVDVAVLEEVPPLRPAKEHVSANRAIKVLQTKMRGFLKRIDSVQRNSVWTGGFRASAIAAALMISDDRDNPTSQMAAKGLMKVTKKIISSIGHVHDMSREDIKRFKNGSKFAAITSKQMRAEISSHEAVDSTTMQPWRIPDAGTVSCFFEALPVPPTELSIQCATGVASLEMLLISEDTVGNRMALLRLTLVEMRLYAFQAQHLLERIQSSARPFDKAELVDVFVMMIPRLMDGSSAYSLIARNLSEAQRLALRAKLGKTALSIFTGAVVGHLEFDLSVAAQRAALCKIVMHDAIYAKQQRANFADNPAEGGGTAALQKAELYRGGTSQNGDWRGYRNLKLNGVAVANGGSFVEQLAYKFGDSGADEAGPGLLKPHTKNILSMDYAGVLRPPIKAKPVAPLQLDLLLYKCGMPYTERHVRSSAHLTRLLSHLLKNFNIIKDENLSDDDDDDPLKKAARLAAPPPKKKKQLRRRTSTSSSIQRRLSSSSVASSNLNDPQVGEKKKKPPLSDLLGPAPAFATQDDLRIWLSDRDVDVDSWQDGQEEALFLELSNGETWLQCEIKRDNKKAQLVIVRPMHYLRARIAHPLEESVLVWIPKSKASMTPKEEDDSSSVATPTTSRERWGKVASAVADGDLSRHEAFVTSRMAMNHSGGIVKSVSTFAVSTVLDTLKSRATNKRQNQQLEKLLPAQVRVLVRAKRSLSYCAFAEPSKLPQIETRCTVHYVEVFIPVLVPPEGETGRYEWQHADEVEDLPAKTEESLTKVVTVFRVRSSALYFTAAQAAKIAESFRRLSQENETKGSNQRSSLTVSKSRRALSAALEAAAKIDEPSPKPKNRRQSVARKQEGEVPKIKRSPFVKTPEATERDPGRSSFRQSFSKNPRLSVNRKPSAPPPLVVKPPPPPMKNQEQYFELLTHLFSRCLDHENFYLQCIEPILPLQSRFDFIDRLGWLNVLNTHQPNTSFDLDLRLADHWKTAHVLTQLATNEDGVNFVDVTFKRTHEDPIIPGWDLPQSWDVEKYRGNLHKGVPKQGHLVVRYTAEKVNENIEVRDNMKHNFTFAGIPKPIEEPVLDACRVQMTSQRQ